MKRRQAPRHAAPKVEVPPELQPQDYGFPRVSLPASRPHPSPQQLHDALTGDDTQPIDGVVLDGEPKPARHEGLSPAAAPSIPDVAALMDRPVSEILGDPDRQTPAAHARRAPDAQATVAALEAAILNRPEPAPVALPVARHRKPGVQHSFGDRFWRDVQALVDRAHAVAETLAAANDRMQAELADRLARLERAHMDAVTQTNAAPLPRRTPGRALAATEARRSELVNA